MGGMPFHLEKGWMGLRFDYLCRSGLVRDYLLAQLQAGADPFVVADNIVVAGVPPIHVLTDPKTTFKARLDQLLAADPPQFDPHERRSSTEYELDQPDLLPINRDTTGNRAVFLAYWNNKKAACADVVPDARAAMIKALEAVGPGVPTLPRPRMNSNRQ